MEADDEVKGKGNSYTTNFRQLDPRIGRWLIIDPKPEAGVSGYCSMDNNPILYNDILGLYTKKRAERMAARGANKGYETKVVENRSQEGDFGVYFKAERTEGTYSKTQYNGKFRGIGRSGLSSDKLHNKGFQTTNVEAGNLHIVKLDDSEYEVGGTAPDIGIGKGISLAKWGWKGLKKLFTKGAAKATVKKAAEYSKEAKAAFLELGTHAVFTTYKKGTAIIKIGRTNNITKKSLSLVEKTLKSNGASSVKVITNVPKAKVRTTLNNCIKNNKTLYGYKVEKTLNPLNPYKLTKKL